MAKDSALTRLYARSKSARTTFGDDYSMPVERMEGAPLSPTAWMIEAANSEQIARIRDAAEDPDRTLLIVVRGDAEWLDAAMDLLSIHGRRHEFVRYYDQGNPRPLSYILRILAHHDVLLAVDGDVPDVIKRIAIARVSVERVRPEHVNAYIAHRWPGATATWPSDRRPTSIRADFLDVAFRHAETADQALETLDAILGHEAAIASEYAGDEQIFNEQMSAEATRRQNVAAQLADPVEPVAAPAGPTACVLRSQGDNSWTPAATKVLWATCKGIAGVPIPLRTVYNDPTNDLIEDWPHAETVIRRLLSKLAIGAVVKLKPTLLVGEPGTGKTSLLQAIAECLDVPSIVFPCASSADNSFGGTPARWNSSLLSTPGETIRQHAVANPVIILDELEKSGRHQDGGSLVDALLPMLEPHTASQYYETALDAKLDLSHVSFVATANTVAIPAPLRDRFDVVRMPDPGPEHIGPIARRIVENIERRRGLVGGMIPPIAPDEEDVIRQAWRGGSLRKLNRIVEALVDNRDAFEIRN